MKEQILPENVSEFLKLFLSELKNSEILIGKKLESKEKLFRNIILGSQIESYLYEELKQIFTQAKPAVRVQFYNSFWRWYTQLLWSRFINLSTSDVIFALENTIPMAALLEFNPTEEVKRNLLFNNRYPDDMELNYTKIKKDFFIAGASNTGVQGKSIEIKSLLVEYKKMASSKDELKTNKAFLGKISRNLKDSCDEYLSKFVTDDFDLAASSIVELFDFFETIQPSNAFDVLAGYSRFTNKNKKASKLAESRKEITIPFKPVEPKKPAQSFSQIKQDITRTTAMTPPVERPGKIMFELDKLATSMKNDKIRELYYFNQQTGKFEWNETLLKE